MADIELCTRCGKGCGKDESCLALDDLYKLYEVKRKEEKRELLSELRSQLKLVDYEPADDIRELAEKLIIKKPELNFINEFGITIGYARAYEGKKSKGRATFADCRKLNGSYLAYLPYDFLITVYDPNMAILSDNQQKIVVYHELRHIGINQHGLYVVPHDIEDFESILREYGLNWSEFDNEVTDILGGEGDAETSYKK
jgi:predicted metallopeptidase